ncbi:MAG: hypothetical protein KAJ03_06320 [Gammaproteobacteria bacterium]|nr:hypothetical protein [Gammaproteobacteria bacterium]
MKHNALLIEFNMRTSKRAGGINPRDPTLQCYGWQNLESTPQIEIRVIEDDRDISEFEGITGVTILSTAQEANAAIAKHMPPQFRDTESGEHVKIYELFK